MSMKADEVVRLPRGVTFDHESCPRCGLHQPFQEDAKRPTWQPFSTKVEDGALVVGEWDVYESGDDTFDEVVMCRGCHASWRTLLELEIEMRYYALLGHVHRLAWEAKAAIHRNAPDADLAARIGREAIAEGGRLDPRSSIPQPDPEPFVRAQLLDIIDAVENSVAGKVTP